MWDEWDNPYDAVYDLEAPLYDGWEEKMADENYRQFVAKLIGHALQEIPNQRIGQIIANAVIRKYNITEPADFDSMMFYISDRELGIAIHEYILWAKGQYDG